MCKAAPYGADCVQDVGNIVTMVQFTGNKLYYGVYKLFKSFHTKAQSDEKCHPVMLLLSHNRQSFVLLMSLLQLTCLVLLVISFCV